jgi:hypothetical protein
MPSLVLLIAGFLLGVLMRRLGRFPESTPSALNPFVINVSLPWPEAESRECRGPTVGKLVMSDGPNIRQ